MIVALPIVTTATGSDGDGEEEGGSLASEGLDVAGGPSENVVDVVVGRVTTIG